MACASTVAVVVPSPAVSDVLLATSRTIWAPMFSIAFLRSISLATVTPSLVMVGEPNFLSMTTLRPLGPSVTLTASARALTPRRMICRESSPYTICFAIANLRLGRKPSGVDRRPPNLLFDYAEDFFLAHDQEIFAVELDLLAGVLAKEHRVASLDVERRDLAVLLDAPLADGD